GEEILWLPRAYSALFWVLGGIFLFLLARELTSWEGGLLAVAFYLFNPFGVDASRSFQPDPLMTVMVTIAWWGMVRWLKKQEWKWVIVVGLFAGTAILVKALAVFAIFGGFLGIFLAYGPLKSLRSLKFWIMGAITALPTLIYMVYGFFIEGSLGDQFSMRFFPSLWVDPVFYLRWEGMLELTAGLLPFIAGLTGIFFFSDKEKRWVIFSHWIGYFLYGMIFAYYFSTHTYYHIGLVPVVALSIAPFGTLIGDRLRALKPARWQSAVLVLIVSAGLFFNLWNIRDIYHKTDYRPLADVYAHIGEVVGNGGTNAIALSQDYNYRLEYWGWIRPSYWPYIGDQALQELAGNSIQDFEQDFTTRTEGKQYFIVTDLEELDRQTQLHDLLYSQYPIYDQGDGYVIFDLLHPLAPSQP
ncbi:MAG TPA: glycosyltransferase family 39 protein, partial [Longilinea sp.]|nr:glycosyltransferase family 39 protein [Longilinea sp.]